MWQNLMKKTNQVINGPTIRREVGHLYEDEQIGIIGNGGPTPRGREGSRVRLIETSLTLSLDKLLQEKYLKVT